MPASRAANAAACAWLPALIAITPRARSSVAEAADLVQCDAHLERARPLEELALETGADRAAREERRPCQAVADRDPGALHVVAGRQHALIVLSNQCRGLGEW